MLKQEIGRWQFLLSLGNSPMLQYGKEFNFAILKFVSWPEEGKSVEKKNYKGFWLRKTWESWFNFEISF
jgi:hypothetical protein